VRTGTRHQALCDVLADVPRKHFVDECLVSATHVTNCTNADAPPGRPEDTGLGTRVYSL
jgi:hypothetical protein